MTHPRRAPRQSLPLSAEEEERFVREMVPVVTAAVGAGRTFRISADTEPLQRMFREITSRASAALGRPLTGYTNGREFWIEPGGS